MNGNVRNFLYVLSFSTSISVIVGNYFGNYFTLLNFVYSIFFLGILEWIVPGSNSNRQTSKTDFVPKLILLINVPLQLVSILSLFYGIYSNTIFGAWIICAALSTGLNSGSSAIVIAHELIHCNKPWERWLGKLLLFTSGNIYFYIEHLMVHHKWVATNKDHASAKYGENLYQFFYRSLTGQIKGAYNLEKQKLIKKGKTGFSLNNYVVRQAALQLVLLVFFGNLFAYLGIFIWLFQCLFANFLLEYVNYIQHYGLTRNENERPTEAHSWESNQFASRFVLVDLSRHADHHYYASKPFHNLINYEKSPKLPSGYSGLFFVAAIPFLWRKLIHKKLNNYLALNPS